MSTNIRNRDDLYSTLKVSDADGLRKMIFKKTKGKVWVAVNRVPGRNERVTQKWIVTLTIKDGSVYASDFTKDGVVHAYHELPSVFLDNFAGVMDDGLTFLSRADFDYYSRSHQHVATLENGSIKISYECSHMQYVAGRYRLEIGPMEFNHLSTVLEFPFTQERFMEIVDHAKEGRVVVS